MSLSAASVYDLAAAGELEKVYIGQGTRNFRITESSVNDYIRRLPRDPQLKAV